MSAKRSDFAETRAQARQKIRELLDAVGIEKINGKKLDYLTTIWRRIIYLEKRIADAAREGKILHYDEHEVAAIRWAVSQAINQEAEIKRLREDIERLRVELQERGKGGETHEGVKGAILEGVY